MTEPLVKFNTAVLAKECGFDWATSSYYFPTEDTGLRSRHTDNHNQYSEPDFTCVSAPTQSLLQKWLREEKDIIVEPIFDFTRESFPYHCNVMHSVSSKGDFRWLGCKSSYTDYTTYEEALEAGLIEALKLLKG